MKKALVSVTGMDRTGIIAKTSAKLYELNINIMDITQTILDGCFTMLMIVDLENATKDFQGIVDDMQPIGNDMGMEIHLQRMDIFDAMHHI